MKDPVVPLERNLYGHPLAGLLWESQFWKVLLEHDWRKVFDWDCLFVKRERELFLSENIQPTWKILMKDDLGEPTSFLDHVYLGCTQRECQISNDIVTNYRNMFESRISAGAKEKLPARASGTPDAETTSSWCYDMEGHAKKCVERYCEIANKTTEKIYKVATPCMDDHQFREEENGSVGELSTVCSHTVVKCLFLVRIGRLDVRRSVNKRLARLIPYIHHTCDYKALLLCGKHRTTMQNVSRL